MSKTTKHLLVIALALLVLTGALGWRNWRSNAGDGALARWGRGKLMASEEAYYEVRIPEIANAWVAMANAAEHGPEGLLREPYATFLVIDTGRCEIWIEHAGQVLEEYRSDLPQQMTWDLHHDLRDSTKPLGPLVRLKFRGTHPDRQFPEIIRLMGQHGNESLVFRFTCDFQGIEHVSSQGSHSTGGKVPERQRRGVAYYDSILVGDAEYEKSRLAWAKASQGTTSNPESPKTRVDQNEAAWARVRKKLYQAIEDQVESQGQGLHLRQLRVKPSPDYSTALADLQANNGAVRSILGLHRFYRSISVGAYLFIDCLGDDVWYARITPNPAHPARPGRSENRLADLPLEFLVSAGPPVPSAARQAWIEKGRARQKEPSSPWTAELPNGAVVEFLGICENPSAGKQWWGPDGRLLDLAPCFNPLPCIWHGNPPTYEFVWRIRGPDNTQVLPTKSSLAGAVAPPVPYAAACNRYGVSQLEQSLDVQAAICAFEKPREKTDLTLDLPPTGLTSCSIRLKNISLIPGKDQGFEIEVVK